MIKNYTIAMTCKANILKEESHVSHSLRRLKQR